MSDLLIRRLYLHWYEGVAIARGVGERLLEQQGTGMRIPELHQVELGAGGAIAITGGAAAREPVRRLGQLLQAVLTDGDVPVQLRLIVSQATAPIPFYSSLAEFDQALAYFERPDRTGLLRALFVRAEAAGPVTVGDVALTLDRIAPLPEAKPTGPRAGPSRKNSRRVITAAAAFVALLAVSGAAARYLRSAGMPAEGQTFARASVATADAVGAVVLAGASAVSNSVGLGRIVAKDEADAAAVPAASSLASDYRKKGGAQAAVRAKPAGARAVESLPPRTMMAYEVPDGRASMTRALVRPAETIEAFAVASIDPVVYAPGADGVSPPVALRRQLPPLPPAVAPADLVQIELLIAQDGSVESARLLSPRGHVLGGMFLSAVKVWKFLPATRDGVPVRNRKAILVSFE
ncbi:MAG: hypothetical protein GEU82_03185 [Luteitalea sp.]|nr:hypothetical protein [Luteitalea sp.]